MDVRWNRPGGWRGWRRWTRPDMTANLKRLANAIVVTLADFRMTLWHEVAQEIRSFFGDLVLHTHVPRSVRLAECPSFGKPICLYDPHSTGAISYQSVTQEVMNRLFEPSPQPAEPAGQQQTAGMP